MDRFFIVIFVTAHPELTRRDGDPLRFAPGLFPELRDNFPALDARQRVHGGQFCQQGCFVALLEWHIGVFLQALARLAQQVAFHAGAAHIEQALSSQQQVMVRLRLGFGVGVQLDQNHELIVKSVNNKPVYYKDPTGFIQQNIYSYLEMRFRPSIYSYHSVRLSYSAYSFSDSLLHIPNYAYHDKAYLNFFTIYYQMKADHRDIAYYPLKGSYFDFLIEQNGLWNSPVNELYVKSNFRIYRQLYKRWYYAAGVTAKYTFTGASPYFLQEGLGYGREFVRGYEYYVIDGTHFALFKNNLKFALIRPGVLDVGFLKSQKFNPIPYAFYLNLFADLGYVYNGDEEQGRINDLQNKLLIGGGFGIDFITYYDIVTRVEFSINRNGFPGVYLHFTAPI